MRNRRAIVLSIAAAFALTGSLSACGDSADIADKIDAQAAGPANNSEGLAAGNTPADQANADADARAAAQALKRRQELADLEKVQQAETDRILKDGVPGGNDEDITIPIGSADPEVERFRARLAGVCSGGQKRIMNVSKDAEKATKSKDPTLILAAAQSYAQALDDFLNALGNLQPPASMKSDYQAWLGTINALATNARLQLVSQGDADKARKLQQKTTDLSAQLIEQSAGLGVTCLSVT